MGRVARDSGVMANQDADMRAPTGGGAELNAEMDAGATDSARMLAMADVSTLKEMSAQVSRQLSDRSFFLGHASKLANGEPMYLPGLSRRRRGLRTLRLGRARNDWTRYAPRELFAVARGAAEESWFASTVLALNEAVINGGFRMRSRAARELVGDVRDQEDDELGAAPAASRARAEFREYPWAAVVSDVVREFGITDHVVAVWKRRRPEDEELPQINILNAEEVDYQSVYGRELIKIVFAQPRMQMDQSLELVLGTELFEAMKQGKEFVVRSWQPSEWDFLVLTREKRGQGYRPPRMMAVFDDLEHVEMTRTGDFNGALMRATVTRSTKIGHAVTGSGPLSGTAQYFPTRHQIAAVLDFWEKNQGVVDIAQRFDFLTEYVTFPTDFFAREVSAEAKQRLAMWGGFPALLLLEGLSQVNSVSNYLSRAYAAQMGDVRERVARFLQQIWNSESFLGTDFGEVPHLAPRWSQRILYDAKDLTNLVTMLFTTGAASPQTIREEFLDFDNEREAVRMKAAHADRAGYMPPFESRQGLLPNMFEDLEPPAPAAPDGTGRAPGDGGDGGGAGRPPGT